MDLLLDPSVNYAFPDGGLPTPQIIATRNPLAMDKYPVGYQWLNTTTRILWSQNGFSSGVPQWTAISSSLGVVTSVSGTVNQIAASAATGDVVLSIPSSPSFGGTVTAASGFTATTGNLTLSGNTSKILINAATPPTASVGVSENMAAGIVTVTSSAVTAASIILYSRNVLGTAVGHVSITAQAPGSFTLTSSAATETSKFNYWIVN